MIRRPPRSTRKESSAASDVYKRQVAPWGIAYQPPATARAVLVNSTEGMVCTGAMMEEIDLEPGELLLFSQGGARIYLKNTGEVVINGQVFAAEGGE